jgi:hypothetical protein
MKITQLAILEAVLESMGEGVVVAVPRDDSESLIRWPKNCWELARAIFRRNNGRHTIRFFLRME